MASLFKSQNVYKLQLTIDGKRRTIGLGQVSKGRANELRGIVERLHDCHTNRRPPGAVALSLVGELPAKLQNRLREVGLLTQRFTVTLGELCDYIHATHGGKPSTVSKRKNVKANLLAYFHPNQELASITVAHAKQFVRWLAKEGGRGAREELAPATVSRRCGMAKSWFAEAVQQGWLAANPFDEFERSSETNSSRDRFITLAVADSLMEECTCPRFRLLIALSRFGGVRVPSEPRLLRWEWIDWQHQVMRVYATKTEHIEGKAARVVPIFPELLPHLEEVFHLADEGDELVFPHFPTSHTDRLQTLCRRCDIALWEKPWQNMRASRETELVASFPEHVAAAWLGNSVSTAKKHYLQVTKEHVAAALKFHSAAFSPTHPESAAFGAALSRAKSCQITPPGE